MPVAVGIVRMSDANQGRRQARLHGIPEGPLAIRIEVEAREFPSFELERRFEIRQRDGLYSRDRLRIREWRGLLARARKGCKKQPAYQGEGCEASSVHALHTAAHAAVLPRGL
jgi:hypothetical protein